jgi:hypothetical protein
VVVKVGLNMMEDQFHWSLIHRLGCKEEAVAHNMLFGFNGLYVNSIGLGGKAAVGAAVEISEFEMAPVVAGGGLI